MSALFDAAQAVEVPKVVLHDHLDGGLRPTTILELADEIGWTPRLPSTDPTELHRWFVRGAETKDLLQYLATFEHTGAVMQRAGDLVRIAREAAVDLAADGVVYAEVRFAPELHVHHGLALDEIVEAVQEGFRAGVADAAAAGSTIVVNTIICAMRTEQRSFEIAQLAVRMRELDARIVAFDIAGAETGWPPSLHADAFTFARANQMHITIHASEPPDLELISDALVHGAERIGHGFVCRPTSISRVGEWVASPRRFSNARSVWRWRRPATPRSVPWPRSRTTRSDRSCGWGSVSASTPTIG